MDTTYSGLVYPDYCSGFGYIVSRPIAEYIAENFDKLKRYSTDCTMYVTYRWYVTAIMMKTLVDIKVQSFRFWKMRV